MRVTEYYRAFLVQRHTFFVGRKGRGFVHSPGPHWSADVGSRNINSQRPICPHLPIWKVMKSFKWGEPEPFEKTHESIPKNVPNNHPNTKMLRRFLASTPRPALGRRKRLPRTIGRGSRSSCSHGVQPTQAVTCSTADCHLHVEKDPDSPKKSSSPSNLKLC